MAAAAAGVMPVFYLLLAHVCFIRIGHMKKDKILRMARGFRGRSKNCIRVAQPRVEKALQYAFRDRRQKKRDMRSLWIQRINAASSEHGVR